ncbi:MAG TPA: nicotinamide-nucleotide amidohydrolase family protein [Paracoccus sp.]|nr:nicotinamide-nucleotide amidohydrolase family protein [Paracoccus sp. (in: a-proteobacteria)]
MIATAESCTGGMVAVALSDLPGSSDVFAGGFVTYSNAMKTAVLGVPAGLIATHGAVSELVARAMAEGALARAGVGGEAGLAVSVTGIAGPGGSGFKPEGRVCFGLATATGCTTETLEFGALGRDRVRRAARDHALALILAALDGAAPQSSP